MSYRIVMLIIMRIKYRFLNYSLAPNANRAHCGYRNKEKRHEQETYSGITGKGEDGEADV